MWLITVRMSDLERETLPRGKGIPAGDGTGPEVTDVVQMAHMIALGRMIAVLPRSLVEPVPAGLACVPVTDAPPSRLVLAWNSRDRRPLVASFVAAALASSRRYGPKEMTDRRERSEVTAGPLGPAVTPFGRFSSAGRCKWAR